MTSTESKLNDIFGGKIPLQMNAFLSAENFKTAVDLPIEQAPVQMTVPVQAEENEGNENTEVTTNQMINYYKMNRTVQDVPMLWKEWDEGLGYNPSIKSLETNYGAKWRPSDTERQFFRRRKSIIEFIQNSVKENKFTSHKEAVDSLERTRKINNWTLNALNKKIITRELDY